MITVYSRVCKLGFRFDSEFIVDLKLELWETFNLPTNQIADKLPTSISIYLVLWGD